MHPQVKSIGLIWMLLASSYLSQAQSEYPSNGYYVVIAAYAASKEDYASRFMQEVQEENPTVEYAFFHTKNMYFVYLEYFTDRSPSISHMRNIRSSTAFDDTWVYVFKDAQAQRTKSTEAQKHDESIETQAEEEAESESNAEQEALTDDVEEIVQDTEAAAIDTEEKIEVQEDEADEQMEDPNLGKYKVFLQITHDRTAEIMDGSVDVIDPNTGNLVAEIPANELHYMNPPNRKDERVQFEAALFGFRKVIHTVDLSDPATEETEFEVEVRNDTTFVYFDLIKVGKGDKFTMYHVYFFSSSAIMRPESQNELMDLLFLLQNNPDFRIKLHGFVNGNGKVNGAKFHLEEVSDFFTQSGAQVKDMSAKELSEARAQALKNYLVYNGIDASRIEVKGWGGKKGIYKVTDPRADKNVRVEVEILK